MNEKMIHFRIDASQWQAFLEAIKAYEHGSAPASVVIRRLIGEYIKQVNLRRLPNDEPF